MKKLIFIVIFLYNSCLSTFVYAQQTLFQHTEAFNLLKQGSQKMYNYDFQEAALLFNQAQKLLPNHPAPVLLQGVLVYWQNLPLATNSLVPMAEMEKLIRKAASLAQTMQDKNKKSEEGIFFEMTARSLLMQHYAKLDQQSKALGEARSIYNHIKTGMKMKDTFNEFYFTTGIYNYYREAYPEAKPMYKPFAWFFQAGDKELGLQQLVYAGKNCVITQTQAWAFLTHIYLTYEKNPFKAVQYAKELVTRYPQNRLFMCRYVETLLLTKQYAIASPQIDLLLTNSSPEPFTVMITQVLAGIFTEKHQKNYAKAKTYYNKVIELAQTFEVVGQQYQAYAYLGLSRIAKIENQVAQAKTYRKKAEKLAEYPYIFVFE
jgi:tetratricopeptide (TPR) repeat protein